MNHEIRDAIFSEPFDPRHPAIVALAERLFNPKSECYVGAKVLGLDGAENKSPEGVARRYRVQIHRCGTRLLDVDNGAGGCKALLDCIRYEGLIPNDDPGVIDFYFTQEKVKRASTGTRVTITPL